MRPAAARIAACCGDSPYDRHRDDHHRRQRRTRVSRACGRRAPARQRLARVLAGHARRHRVEARAPARHRLRVDPLRRRARQGIQTPAARPVRAAVGVLAKPRHHPAPGARCRARTRRLRLVPGGADGGRVQPAAADSRRERGRRACQSHSRLWRRPHPARISRCARQQARRQGRVGRQSAARGDSLDPAARAALRRKARHDELAGRRRELGRNRAERTRAGRARAARSRIAAVCRAPGRRAPYRRAAARLRGGRGRGGLPAFHRRHRAPVCRRGSRHLPRRRIDDFRARRRRRRQRDRAAAGRIRRRAVAQRAIPGRRGRGGHAEAIGDDRSGACRPAACDESRPVAGDGDRGAPRRPHRRQRRVSPTRASRWRKGQRHEVQGQARALRRYRRRRHERHRRSAFDAGLSRSAARTSRCPRRRDA